MPVDPLKQEPEVEVPDRRRTMLVPVAYSESVMPALRLARSSRIARRIAKWLFAGLLLTTILMAFAPWQQSVTGSGNVLAYTPGQRPQVIQSPIEGAVFRWGEGIVENSRVREGDFLAEIRDIDESYSDKLDLQLSQAGEAVTFSEDQLEASRNALEVARTIIKLYEAQVEAYESVKRETIAAQDAYVEMARKKVSAEKEQLLEYKAAVPQLQAQFDRTKKLEGEGNLSLLKFQEVERKLTEAKAKVKRAEAYVSAAKSELEGKERDRVAKIEKAQVAIDYAKAEVRKANQNVEKAKGDVAKAEEMLTKTKNYLVDMDVKVARQKSRKIPAPFDGIVVQITPNMGTGVLKKGDPICTIVPETKDRSVQLRLDGNDAPLVEPGRHVRLQFEGWPAVQFAGWPSVAVGTFGGEIVSVDATDNGKGKFRVLIRPDVTDKPWPEERFLRQGVRANGWVLLNRVPLWFEVWRQLNGFPPVVDVDGSPDKGSKSKPPKLPK